MHETRLLAVLLLCSWIQASAHDDLLGTRYVAATGVDQGYCDHAREPCRTIAYAIAHGLPGGTVKVAEGLYSIEGLDIDDILHGKTGVLGGFSTQDEFRSQDFAGGLTKVFGAAPMHRQRLGARGLQLIVDDIASRRPLPGEGLDNIVQFHAASLKAQAAMPCVQGTSGQFPCRNVEFLGRLALAELSSQPDSMSNLWGFVDRNDGREYAVVGLRNGTAVVDVTDPEAPREVGTVAGNSSLWREVKVYQFFDTNANRFRTYAYVTTEANQGLQVIDFSGLPGTVQLANTVTAFQTAHTLYVSNVDYSTNEALSGNEAFLYVAGSNRSIAGNQGSFLIFDLDNPAAPQLVTEAPAGTGYMHDSTNLLLTGSRAAQCEPGHDPCEVLVDFNEDSVDLWDVTSKAQPVRLSSTTYPTARYTHSGWPTEDQRAILVHDELDELRIGNFNTHLYTLEIDDLRSPTLLTSFTGCTTTTDHNGYTRGNRYYVAHYRRGLVVFDLTDPRNLREVGNLDTFLTPRQDVAGTDGAWGVYPFLPSGNILVSDIDNGLFILRDNTRNLGASPGLIGFAVTSATIDETAATLNLQVRRTGGNQGGVSVQFATGDGTAQSGSDYTARSGTLSWNAGDDSDRAIAITIGNDTTVEGNETFTVMLSALTGGASLDGAAELTVTLVSEDGASGGAGGGGGGGSADEWWLLLLLILPWRLPGTGAAETRTGPGPRPRADQNRSVAEAVANHASSTPSMS